MPTFIVQRTGRGWRVLDTRNGRVIAEPESEAGARHMAALAEAFVEDAERTPAEYRSAA